MVQTTSFRIAFRLRNACRHARLLACLACCLSAASAHAGPDDDAAAKQNLAAPAVWSFPPQTPLRVLAVRGLWYGLYGMDSALARGAHASVTDSWHNTSSVMFYPESYAGLMRNHLVVVCNINGNAFGPIRRKMLKDYVSNGGSVLLLGGRYGYSEYKGTALEELMPVTIGESAVAVQAAGGLVLKAGADAPAALGRLAWAQSPRVYWYHKLQPKPGAKVLVTAGDQPLLVTGTFGKGRVAAFAGSVMGVPGAQQTPFWEWKDWPRVLGQTIQWLTEPAAPDAARGVKMREAIAAQIKAAEGDRTKEEAVLSSYSAMCADKETARVLLQAALSGDGDTSHTVAAALGERLDPFIDASFVPLAKSLLAIGGSGKASLGLRLLGRAKAPEARGILESALASGEVDTGEEPAALEDLKTEMEDPAQSAYAIRIGALQGLGSLGDPAAIPALKKFMARTAPSLQKPMPGGAKTDSDLDLYAEAAVAALRCGDTTAAATAVDAVMQHRYVLYRLLQVVDQPVYDNSEATKLSIRLASQLTGAQLARWANLLTRLNGLPDSVLLPVAQRVAKDTVPDISAVALAAFGGRKLAPTVAAALQTSQIKQVRDIGALGAS